MSHPIRIIADPERGRGDDLGTGHGVPLGTLGLVVGVVTSSTEGATPEDPLLRVRTLRHGEVACWGNEIRPLRTAPTSPRGLP